MMQMIWSAINMAWKVLGLVGAWMLFKYLLRDGKETIQDLFETASMALQAGLMTIKRKLWNRIKKEARGTEEDKDDKQPMAAEGTVN